MTFTQTFGGTTIYPAGVSYRAVALSADQTLSWPVETATNGNIVAQIMDVTPSAGSLSIIMPPANEVSVGETTLFFNPGAFSFTVKDNGGNTIVAIAPGLSYQVYLIGNSTVNGTWRSTQYAAGTSVATAGSLVGAGIKAISSTLNQSMSVTTLNSNYAIGDADRSEAFVWNGGAGAFTLPSSGTVGNDWFCQIRNSGTGAITLTPTGSELINGAPNLTFNPGDSAIVICDGSAFFTIGFGQSAAFAFDYVSIDLSSPVTSPYTLSGANLNRIAYSFGGTLTANMEVLIPATIQQYWISNDTSGAFSLTVKVAGQTGVVIPQGSRGIYYCNGTDIIDADTASFAFPLTVAQGGTGATTESGARVNLGGTSVGIGVFTAATAADGRNALIAAKSGANSDITSLTGLTTPLSVPQGGTGVATLTANGVVLGNGASALAVTAVGTTGQVLVGNTGAAPTWATLTGIGVTSFSAGSTGLTPSTATTGAITLAGTLGVANGGTGVTSSTGTVAVVLSNSPTLVTPTLGAASATSIANALGAVGTPSYTFTGDLNTGMWSPAADTIAFSANGTERMRLSTAGNLGVNVTPSVWSGFTAVEMSTYGAVASSSGTMDVINNAFNNGSWVYKNTNFASLFRQEAGAFKFFTAPSGTAATAVSFTERMRLTEAGDVGIGTTSPSSFGKLATINSSGSTALYAGTTTQGVFVRSDNTTRIVQFMSSGSLTGGFSFSNGLADNVTIDVSGNVGIGTTSPSTKLQVTVAPSSSGDNGMRVTDGTRIIQTNITGSAYSYIGIGASETMLYSAGNPLNIVSDGQPIKFIAGTAERMRLDTSGNLGIGITPSVVYGRELSISSDAAAGVGTFGSRGIATGNNILYMANNAKNTGAFTNSYWTSAPASQYTQNQGAHYWYNAPSGTAGNAITFTQAMAIDINGNIQIGPSGAFSIAGTKVSITSPASTNTYVSIYGGTGSTNGGLLLGGNNAENFANIFWNTSSNLLQIAATPVSSSIKFDTAGSERMRIDGSGNVGIGTTGPSSYGKLAVIGNIASSTDGATILTMRANAGATTLGAYNTTASSLSFTTNTGGAGELERMRITDVGNVGIGTSSPANQLDVVGTASARSNVSTGNSPLVAINTNTGSNTTKYTSLLFQGYDTIGTNKNVGLVVSGPSDANYVTSYMAFQTRSGDALSERMRVTSAGDVGIGTSSPGTKLEVNGITKINTASPTWEILQLVNTQASSGAYMQMVGAPGGTVAIGADAVAASTMIFRTAGAERMRITSTGNVGIGVTSPAEKLDVAGNAKISSGSSFYWGDATSQITAVNAGAMRFLVGNGGEKMRIDGTGKMQVGTTSSAYSAANSIFEAEGGSFASSLLSNTGGASYSTLYVYNKSTTGNNELVGFGTEGTWTARGSINYNRTAGLTAYNTTSDYRAKDILGPVTDAGATIDALKIYNGKMKGATVARPMLIAHEAQEITPYAVTGEKDAVNEDGAPKFQQMDVSSLVPLLIAEVQSLRARVAQLEGN